MNFLKFLISKVFLKNLAYAFAALLIIVFSTLLWLKIYTHHSTTMTVPDFTGLNLEEVEIIARTKKLRIEVADSSFTDDIPKGTVIRQNPFPGIKVKEDRRIYLTMNAINPEMVIMPKVTGVSLRQAKAILETYSLYVGKISYKPNIAVNNVLEQRMKDTLVTPGIMVNKGSPVDLVLGMGLSNERTPVPDLTGISYLMAKNLLIDRYLNIGAVIYDISINNSDDSINAFIWRQRPAFEKGGWLNLGSNVDIWLSTDSTKLPGTEEMKLNLDNEDEGFQF